MTIPSTHIRHIFGMRTGISGCIAYLDENTIVYPCGSNLVLYNMETRVQRFMAGLKKSEGMNAMAVSPNRRFLALAEKAERKPIITIYDLHSLKKTKTLLAPNNINVKNFVHVVFSPDSKFIAAQGNELDWSLLLWSWEKGKLLTSVKTASGNKSNISQISFNRNDNTQLCVVGDGILKNYRYVDSEKNLRQYGKAISEYHSIICHAWITDVSVVVGTKGGLLFLVENGEISGQFDMNAVFSAAYNPSQTESDRIQVTNERVSTCTSSNEAISDQVPGELEKELSKEDLNTTPTTSYPVTALVAFSSGFAAACGPGTISWFELVSDVKKDTEGYSVLTQKEEVPEVEVQGKFPAFPYQRMYEIRIPQDPNSADPVRWANSQVISQMDISPGQESLVCSSNSHQLYHFSLSSLEMTKVGGHCHLELLSSQSFHHDTILGLDVCLRKPIIATCSSDNSVRIWNFETNQLELYKEFAEEIFSIALHPSGLHVLVGFSDKMRLMNLLIDDIRPFKEFNIRNCRECSFSTGGQLIAAVNGHLIVIYSATTFQLTATLKGHNGKIKSLLWSTNDRKLISCGMDGAVYEWDPFSGGFASGEAGEMRL